MHPNIAKKSPAVAGAVRQGKRGFTLIELVVTIAIIGILATIAYPSYSNSITRSKRRAAEACLSSFATHMERYYTTNLSYCNTGCTGNITLPTLDCSTAQNTGKDYTYGFSGTATTTTYTLQAIPNTGQSTRDAACGTLSIDQTGTRSASGSAGVSGCW